MDKAVETGGRTKLPNRRETDTLAFEWRGQPWTVSIYVEDGDIREMFVAPSGAKPGSDSHAAVNDAAILVSRLLQHGERLSDLLRSLSVASQSADQADVPLIRAAMAKALEIAP